MCTYFENNSPVIKKLSGNCAAYYRLDAVDEDAMTHACFLLKFIEVNY